jgi:Eukaryotic aspartyl protease
VRVGNPPQDVNVFVSTAGDQTWVIRNPDACSGTPDPGQCSSSRGGLFSINKSTTWIQNNFSSNGVFNVGLESNLNYTASAQYGYDTVTLGVPGSGGPSLDQQVVAAMADYPFWLGTFGVNPAASNFTDLNHPVPSYMANLRSSGLIPSTSYGYTAGNTYRLNRVFGSLILGGFDASKFVPNNLTWAFNEDVTRDLVVNVASISMSTGGSNITLSNKSFSAFIDSTVPYFYLPADACRQFEQAFGLTYDNKSQLYLVNDTLRARLQAQAPTVTFSLANLTSPDWVNITLPYDAFDLTADWPLVTNKTSYFPLREAADETETTLGRAFLQEA